MAVLLPELNRLRWVIISLVFIAFLKFPLTAYFDCSRIDLVMNSTDLHTRICCKDERFSLSTDKTDLKLITN